MKKITRSIAAVSLATVMALSFTGCQKSDTEDSAEVAAANRLTSELRQNDYRGGITRTNALQTSILKVMEDMKANNTVIRQDSPNSFWTADGYQDFVSTFLDIAIINDTQWFNEEETDWNAILTQLVNTENSFCDVTSDGNKMKTGVTVTRNEKDDYSVTAVPCNFNITYDDEYFTYSNNKANYRILYDCDKDWCKAYATTTLNADLPPITTELFEYQRVDNNTFAVQTSRERLVVVLTPAENDTDIREREVKEFYYSKLVAEGERTTFEPFEPLPETEPISNIVIKENIKTNEMMTIDFPFLNMDGDIASRYGENDSMFFRSPQDIKDNWVFEDKALQQAITYKDGVLVVTTYNKLSANYERFIYSRVDADSTIIAALEGLVEIKNLVGIQTTETVTTVTPTDSTSEATGTDAETEEGTTETPEATEETTEELPDDSADSEIRSGEEERELAMNAADGGTQAVSG